MKNSSRRYHTDVYGLSYRGIGYEVCEILLRNPEISNYFCAYFYLDTTDVELHINLRENPEVNMDRLPLSIFSSCGFLGSTIIDEIEEVAHKAFTLAQIQTIVKHQERKLVTTECVKLGVDYSHLGDEEAQHTLESVCEDCERVIDKIHDMGIFKETKNET